MSICLVCKGTGIMIKLHVPQLSKKFTVEILFPCTFCKGKGVTPNVG